MSLIVRLNGRWSRRLIRQASVDQGTGKHLSPGGLKFSQDLGVFIQFVCGRNICQQLLIHQ